MSELSDIFQRRLIGFTIESRNFDFRAIMGVKECRTAEENKCCVEESGESGESDGSEEGSLPEYPNITFEGCEESNTIGVPAYLYAHFGGDLAALGTVRLLNDGSSPDFWLSDLLDIDIGCTNIKHVNLQKRVPSSGFCFFDIFVSDDVFLGSPANVWRKESNADNPISPFNFGPYTLDNLTGACAISLPAGTVTVDEIP